MLFTQLSETEKMPMLSPSGIAIVPQIPETQTINLLSVQDSLFIFNDELHRVYLQKGFSLT